MCRFLVTFKAKLIKLNREMRKSVCLLFQSEKQLEKLQVKKLTVVELLYHNFFLCWQCMYGP